MNSELSGMPRSLSNKAQGSYRFLSSTTGIPAAFIRQLPKKYGSRRGTFRLPQRSQPG
jgi:hypothetical protein